MAVVSVEFDDFRKVVIDGIKFKILFTAPFDSFRQSFAGVAGPEDEFVAVAFPFLEIFNQCMVGLTKLRPFAVTQGTVKINSNGLEIQLFLIVHSAHAYILRDMRKDYNLFNSQLGILGTEKETFTKYLLKEKTISDIAEDQGITYESARQQMQKIKVRMKKQVKRFMDGQPGGIA